MINPENDLPHLESGKLILLLFAKIWIDHFIFRIKKFEVDKSPPGLLLDWLITNKQDPPTYRAGKREESGCETCAVKCIVHPHTTEGRFFLNVSLHWNVIRMLLIKRKKYPLASRVSNFFLCHALLMDQKPVVGFIDVISQLVIFNLYS